MQATAGGTPAHALSAEALAVEAKHERACLLAQQRSCTLQEGVRRRLSAWRQIGAPNRVMRILREGARCEWLSSPPEPFHHGVSRLAYSDWAWWRRERDRCFATGAFAAATDRRFVSRAFITWHHGKRRLVIDLRHVNAHMTRRGCRFESLARLRRMLRRGDWMFSVDLQDVYHHVGIHEESQRYFTFAVEVGGSVEYISCSALNFGWSHSPEIFTAVMRPVVAYMRSPATAGRPTRFGQRQRAPRTERPDRRPPRNPHGRQLSEPRPAGRVAP